MREISREEQRNATNRDRTGPERRKGDVSPEQFSDAFGFRGVQFGNYVEGPRRQADLNRAYDSLHDLADVLNVPTMVVLGLLLVPVVRVRRRHTMSRVRWQST